MSDPVVLRPKKRELVQAITPERKKPELARGGKQMQVDAWLKNLLRSGARKRPGFAEAWLGNLAPEEMDVVRSYKVAGATVDICVSKEAPEAIYKLKPAEYFLPDNYMKLLYQAKQEFVSRTPHDMSGATGKTLKERSRRDANELLSGMLRGSDCDLGQLAALGGIDFLTETLLKHTVGLGVLEYMLEDEHIQDIYVDAPADETPVHVIIGDLGDDRVHGKCLTNVVLSEREVKALVSRFRYESGRPFSEAMPVLETDLHEYDTRVTVIGRPLSPEGTALALRRHSVEPWTLPKLINKGSLSPLAAGLLSFLIDGRSTILVAGSRGAGKSSFLGALMLEFPLSQRILTIEDTLELPTSKMQELGYKVQSLFVQSAIGGIGERTADDALRVSLRLGESAIVLGEVRGREARTLYEAMRSGSAGSAVLGTIHGNSPKAVFDRVVYDLGIHKEAFTATDIVVICGLVRPEGKQRQIRRVTSIAEVVKEGEPGRFEELLRYDEASDCLVETERFLSSSSRISKIARDWGLAYQEAVDNIRARATVREMLVKYSGQNQRLLAPDSVVMANSQFWSLIDRLGSKDPARLEQEWTAWFERSAPYV